jgi:hypothetical protein
VLFFVADLGTILVQSDLKDAVMDVILLLPRNIHRINRDVRTGHLREGDLQRLIDDDLEKKKKKLLYNYQSSIYVDVDLKPLVKRRIDSQLHVRGWGKVDREFRDHQDEDDHKTRNCDYVVFKEKKIY